jgi:hypothetical protein
MQGVMITFITFGPQEHIEDALRPVLLQACHHERTDCLHQCHPSLQTWPLDCVHLGTPVLSMSFHSTLEDCGRARARFDLGAPGCQAVFGHTAARNIAKRRAAGR